MTPKEESLPQEFEGSADFSKQLYARVVQLEKQLNEDALTGVKSRLALSKRIESSDPNIGSLLVIDIDGFRDVNHHYGHGIGDKLLKEIGENLKYELDGIADIYRWGGDEFCIVTPPIHASALQALGNRVCEVIRGASVLSGCLSVARTASIGMAQREEMDNIDDLFDLADKRMYNGKSINGNCAISDDLHRIREEASIDAVRRALQKGEIEYYVQPIFDITSGEIHSYEALLRWIDGADVKLPNIFLNQMTQSYDEETRPPLEKAQEVARWATKDRNSIIHFNISTQFLERAANIDLAWVEQIIGDINPSKVVFEVVETVAMPKSTANMSRVIEGLRDIGIRIAIDDFGIGESSIERLQILDVDIVKIDRKFLHNVYSLGRGPDILYSLKEMIDRKDAIAMIEGVETAEQLELIKDIGFTYAQGYFLGKPNSTKEWSGGSSRVN